MDWLEVIADLERHGRTDDRLFLGLEHAPVVQSS